MTPGVLEFLDKAEASLRAATLLQGEGFVGFAASRAYYTTLYAANALLLTKDLAFSKHSAVIAAFGKQFALKNDTFRKLHRYLIDAESLRTVGDYSIDMDVTPEQTEAILQWATEFLDYIREVVATGV